MMTQLPEQQSASSNPGIRDFLKKLPGATRLKMLLRLLRSVYGFTKGYFVFWLTGASPPGAAASLAHLYCVTDGRLSDGLTWAARLRYPPRHPDTATGVLGALAAADIRRIAGQIEERGCYIFEHKLSPEVCDELTRFALAVPCIPLVGSSADSLTRFRYVPGPPCLYDRNHIISPRYDFDSQTVAENPVVQQLVADPSILAIAEQYLQTQPINDVTTMWWSTALLAGKGSSAAAQFYHFDIDRIKFIKFFFYLTDVDADTGPHCFVAKSHRRKPRELRRGSRIADEEIARQYPRNDILEITGPRGTIVAADTTGFHKGKPLVRGERLLLQLQYETSRFGTNYPRIQITDKFPADFRAQVRNNPRLFENYRL